MGKFRTSLWVLLITLITQGILYSVGDVLSTHSGKQVQLPQFLDNHFGYPRRWQFSDQAPNIPTPNPLAIYGNNVISQTFTSQANKLSKIGLPISTSTTTTAKIVINTSTQQFEGTVEIKPNKDFYLFTLPEPVSIQGEEITIFISSPKAKLDNPLLLRSINGDQLGHSLHINYYPQPNNLQLFAYGTYDGIMEQILPNIFLTRLQQYKPESLKGNTFSILILLNILGILFFLFYVAIQNGKANQLLILLSCCLWGISGIHLMTNKLILNKGTLLSESPQNLPQIAIYDSLIFYDFASQLWTSKRVPDERFFLTLSTDSGQIISPPKSTIEYQINLPSNSELVFQRSENYQENSSQIWINDISIWKSSEDTTLKSNAWKTIDLSPWEHQFVTIKFKSINDSDSPSIWNFPHLRTKHTWLSDIEDDQFPIFKFNNQIELSSVESVIKNNEISLNLAWRLVDEELELYSTIFIHVLNESGEIIGQSDSQPVKGYFPIAFWPTDLFIHDTHTISFEENQTPTQLRVGIYNPETSVRWNVTDANGILLPNQVGIINIR